MSSVNTVLGSILVPHDGSTSYLGVVHNSGWVGTLGQLSKGGSVGTHKAMVVMCGGEGGSYAGHPAYGGRYWLAGGGTAGDNGGAVTLHLGDDPTIVGVFATSSGPGRFYSAAALEW